MLVKRLPRTGDAIQIIIVADDGSEHRFCVWEHMGDDGAKGQALAVEQVRKRMAKANG